MRTLKIATWNVEHAQELLDEQDAQRMKAVADEIRGIDADVLCMVEGPWSVSKLRAWLTDAAVGLAGEWFAPLLDGTEALLGGAAGDHFAALKGLYGMQGTQTSGKQWIWFLVRSGLANEMTVTLQSPSLWNAFTGGSRWAYRAWPGGARKVHQHWRQPQVLRLSIDGFELDLIGAHLKSKINTASPFDRTTGDLSPRYVEAALDARIKLTSEVHDLRRYIDARFAQEADPRIIVMGDFNDGPGREYFEREYLHHDLIGNLQGDVFLASRFLNHALFDFDDALRWSTEFRDSVEVWARTLPHVAPPPPGKLDLTRRQLIDHMLFTQALSGPGNGPKVPRGSGKVEHVVHERTQAALPPRVHTSDHRPVSMLVELRP